MTVQEIKKTIEETFKVELSRRTRGAQHVDARRMFCYIVYWMFPEMALRQIGEIINRDHAAVYHSIQVYTDILSFDKRERMRFNIINEMINFEKVVNSKYSQYKGVGVGSLERELAKLREFNKRNRELYFKTKELHKAQKKTNQKLRRQLKKQKELCEI